MDVREAVEEVKQTAASQDFVAIEGVLGGEQARSHLVPDGAVMVQ